MPQTRISNFKFKINEPMKTIIIDSIQQDRESVNAIALSEFPEQLKVIGSFASLTEAKLDIVAQKPNLIIIKKEIVESSDFSYLQTLDINCTEIIVISKFDKRAVFKSSNSRFAFFEYPYTKEQLIKRINKAIDILKRKKMDEDQLIIAINKENIKGRKIAIDHGHHTIFVEKELILWAESDGGYLTFYLAAEVSGSRSVEDGKYYTILSSKSISYWEPMLAPKSIVRVHNQFLVNIPNVELIKRGDEPSVIVKGGKEVFISGKYRHEVLALFPKT